MLILSIFPGMGVWEYGITQENPEWCIVRGPDVIWGGNIENFHPPGNVFNGIIGGDPCQAHSRTRSLVLATSGHTRFPDMTEDYIRVVSEAQPEWFLRENVPQAPDLSIHGYTIEKFPLNSRWLGEDQDRKRVFWFGSKNGVKISPHLDVVLFESQVKYNTLVSGHGPLPGKRAIGIKSRWTIEEGLEQQGLPIDFFKFSPFSDEGKRVAIAEGVHVEVGRILARAIKRAYS